jgi:hypothetical protein
MKQFAHSIHSCFLLQNPAMIEEERSKSSVKNGVWTLCSAGTAARLFTGVSCHICDGIKTLV